MTKQKTTKKALLFSVLSMMLCIAMLVGSTFAWFTDSVTSGKNKIVAGNLDVELYAKNDAGEYTAVTAGTNLFLADALWEPGHVETVNLKVANLGTLALTYQLCINIASEKGSTNVNDEAFKLSDYIKFAVLDGEQTFADRDAAIAAADATAVDLSAIAVNEGGVLYPNGKGEAEKLVTLVVYMPTTVGNEANYQTGYDAPEIELGINLVATQTPYENDSFGDNYDSKQSMNADRLTAEGYSAVGSLENLEYNIDDPNASNPEAFITSSGKLFLNNDIDQTVTYWIFFSGESTTLDLNGHYQRETLFIDNGTNLTITDSLGGGSIKFVDVYNGTVTLENCDTKLHQGNGCIVAHEGGTMIINGGEHNPMLISAQDGGTIIINDGKFNSIARRFQTFGSGTITVNGGTFIFDVANKEGIILGEGKQCVDNGDGTWSVVPIVDDENFDDPFAS